MTAADSQKSPSPMMQTTTTNTTTNTNNTNINTTTTTAQQQRPRKEKWMRAPKPQEKRRAARIVLEAAGLLLSVGARTAAAEGGRADNDEWRYQMALNARLREQSVVAAARRLFPSLVGLAMRQHRETADSDRPSRMQASLMSVRHQCSCY